MRGEFDTTVISGAEGARIVKSAGTLLLLAAVCIAGAATVILLAVPA